MKRIISAIAIVCVMLTLGTTAAFAHGHNGFRSAPAPVQYAVCDIESCTLAGIHAHDSHSYAGHYSGDGHDYHGVCAIQACTQAGYHEHDGEYCFGHSINDGHSYHNSGRRSRGCHR